MSTDMERRITLIQNYPQTTELSSSFLEFIVGSALQKFLDYTHQDADLGSSIDDIVVELAIIKINMLGAEGSSSASEGGVSRVWDDIPSSLKKRMNQYRRMIGYADDS